MCWSSWLWQTAMVMRVAMAVMIAITVVVNCGTNCDRPGSEVAMDEVAGMAVWVAMGVVVGMAGPKVPKSPEGPPAPKVAMPPW